MFGGRVEPVACPVTYRRVVWSEGHTLKFR